MAAGQRQLGVGLRQIGGVPARQGQLPIHDAAMRYKADGVPLVIFAGKEYSTGSSRDWAAKGTVLLCVRAVIVESFERIDRSNLVGMGVLPPRDGRGARIDAPVRADRGVRIRAAWSHAPHKGS